jgi:hypothetical protein
VLEHLAGRLGNDLPLGNRTMLHYLDGKVDADLFLDAAVYQDPARIEVLQRRCDEIIAGDPYFRAIQLHRSHAQE